jgi:adhesin/invasin
LSWWLLAAPARALGPTTTVTVQLTPSLIAANGTSTSTAVATAKDMSGNQVPGDIVTISSNDPNEVINPTLAHDNGDGTYTATITSSTTPGSPTITANDTTAGVSGHATLIQYGPATSVSVQLAPNPIVANGSSTSTATATVRDANLNPVPGDTLGFSASDSGIHFSSVTDHGDGTYTATLTSSTTVGSPTITATDNAGPSGQATLTQAGNPSTTTISAVPSTPATNEQVTLAAAVTSSMNPSGTVTFESGGRPIGCANDPVSTSGQIVTCVTSFSALTSPEQLTAVFTPTPGSNVAGSTSAADALVVNQDSTSTTLQVPSDPVNVGAKATYTASVTPSHAGFANPSGTVRFVDRLTTIKGCASRPLTMGRAALTATCTPRYKTRRTHKISAFYSGDANFSGSASSRPQLVTVRKAPTRVLGTITSTMQWTFFFMPASTRVLAMVVNGAPVGASVVVDCQGRGCPFGRRSATVTRPKRCKPRPGHGCPAQHPGTIDLAPLFSGHRLRVGAQVTVKIVRANWIGKYYAFVIRSGQAPSIRIACLAPGASRPGVGC